MDLHDAVETGRLASVRRALKDGASVGELDTLRRTPLHVAAERGRDAIAALLIDHGARVGAKDYRKATPLHAAAGVGHLALVERLLDAGASARVKDSGKCTPLHRIAKGGGKAKGPARVAIVERLLEAECPLDARDSVGRTALWFAAATGTSPRPSGVRKARLAVLATLLERGARRIASNTNPRIRPVEAAQGLHQSRRYRIVWDDAVALLS